MTRRDPNGRAYTSSERGPPDRARIGSLCATIHSGSQVKRMRMGEAADVAAGTASGNTGGVHGACSSHSAFSFPTHPPWNELKRSDLSLFGEKTVCKRGDGSDHH